MTNLLQSEFETWEEVKRFYKERFGIEPVLVELMSDINILRLCATGASNNAITEFLSLPLEDELFHPVSDVIDKYYGFRGWANNLDYSPLRLLESGELTDELQIRVCETYLALERLLDEKWI